jgi:hypothetical protein
MARLDRAIQQAHPRTDEFLWNPSRPHCRAIQSAERAIL